MTKVIHIRNKTGSPDEVYIGRGSKWGNPFPIKKDYNRACVISMYGYYLEGDGVNEGKGKHLLDDIEELRGKTLVCYCKPQACHGDVLVNILNRLGEDK